MNNDPKEVTDTEVLHYIVETQLNTDDYNAEEIIEAIREDLYHLKNSKQ